VIKIACYGLELLDINYVRAMIAQNTWSYFKNEILLSKQFAVFC
jgi:hypothetical protein